MIALGIGLMMCVVASAIFYLGCPNQQWLPSRFYKAKTGALLSGLFALASTWVFTFVFSVPAAIYTVITLYMLSLSLLPLIHRFEKPQTALKGAGSSLKRSDSYLVHMPHWWLKSIGAVVVGLPLGLFTSGLVSVAFLGNTPLDVKSQFMMWWITPIWLLLIALIYFTHRPRRTLFVLSIVVVIEYGLLQVIR